MPALLLLFIIMPIVEITVLIQVGSVIGVLPTVLIVVLTAILGSAMLRHQGLATLAKARQRMDKGEMPAHELVEGLMLVIGGVLLLTPGFVTDAMGFLCLVPVTRHWIASRLGKGALLRMRVTGGAAPGSGPGASSGHRAGVRARREPRTVGEGVSDAASAQDAESIDTPGATGGAPTGHGTSTGQAGADQAPTSSSGSSSDAIDGDFRRVD